MPDNYHIEYDGHYYSVFYKEHGKPAILKASFDKIIICDQYNKILCTHSRSYKTFPKYITEVSHMPPEHLYYHNVNTKDDIFYRSWSKSIAPSLGMFIDRLINSYEHKEQAYNSCNGLLQRCKQEPFQIIEKAASFFLETNNITYTGLKRALDCNKAMIVNGTSDNAKQKELPIHSNIRGKEEYK